MAKPPVPATYGRWFDWLLSVPLALYVFLLFGLVFGTFIKVSPAAMVKLFSNPAVRDAMYRSLITSTISVGLAFLVSVPSGYILSRRKFPGRSFVDTILDLPIILPPLVMGLCILLFFSRTSTGRFLDRGLIDWIADVCNWVNKPSGLFVFNVGGIIIAQFIVGCAFALRVIKSGFDSLNPCYEDVAMTLGAGRWQTFTRVTLPNVAPALVAGVVVSWARIFGLFGPILLLCGTTRYKTEIMPTTIYLEYSIGNLDGALVIAACMIIFSLTALFIFKKLTGRQSL